MNKIIKNLPSLLNCYAGYFFNRKNPPPPLQIIFEITYRCNCRCVMCPIYGAHNEGGKRLNELFASQQELSTDEIKEIIAQLNAIGVRIINFTGGEPTLRHDFAEIAEYAHNLNKDLSINLTSNGDVILKDEDIEKLVKSINTINFSLDGPQKIHDEIRKKEDCFRNLMANVDRVNYFKRRSELKTPRLNFCCTVSKNNENHLAELVGICNEKNAALVISPVFFTSPELESATGKLLKLDCSPKRESHSLCASLINVDKDALYGEIKKAKRLAVKLKVPFVNVFLNSRKDIVKRFYDISHHFANRCFYPWYASRIDPYGNVYCCSISLVMGNLRKNKFMEIWQNKKYNDFRSSLKSAGIFPRCTKCCVLTRKMKLFDFLPKGLTA